MSRSKQQEHAIETQLDPKEMELERSLVTFALPEHSTPVEVNIAKDFVRLDHRSLRMLGRGTAERGEVRDLLTNVATFLQSRQPDAARGLLSNAEAVYYQHIQAKNRVRYLGGMLIGIIAMLAFGVLLVIIPNPLATIIPPSLLPLLLLFAGMGTIASVLTRLSSIDLHDQTSLWIIYVSGMARPVTGVFFALVVYLIVALRIVDLHLGVPSDTTPTGLFLITAFMSGFSERWAKDILARLGGGTNPSDSEERPPDAKPGHSSPSSSG